MNTLFRAIPSVDVCLERLLAEDTALADAPRTQVRELVTAYWDARREDIRAGRIADAGELALAASQPALLRHVRAGLRPRLVPVINATGVVIHTNLGRSVLCREAQEAVARAAAGYCNLEMDLATGQRGSRHSLVEDLLCRLTGAEAALVVNNNAAAVMLLLDTFCQGGEVVVSRGELVEIGGSFRIPDIMAKSDAVLREVGTTNRTHLRDFADAINDNTRALLRVHTSNYRIVGFHTKVALEDMAALAHGRGLYLFEDLGSGSLLDLNVQGLPDEPAVPAVIKAGADVVTFSGDKVLGGPQAGILAGKKELIAKIKGNPLTRALRCDKLCLAALEATLRQYLDADVARRTIPTLAGIAAPAGELARRARSLASRLRKTLGASCRVSTRADVSRVGGGAFPQYDLPTTLVCLAPAAMGATALKQALLATEPPVIGRLEDDTFCLDPRTLSARDLPLLARALASVLNP